MKDVISIAGLVVAVGGTLELDGQVIVGDGAVVGADDVLVGLPEGVDADPHAASNPAATASATAPNPIVRRHDRHRHATPHVPMSSLGIYSHCPTSSGRPSEP